MKLMYVLYHESREHDRDISVRKIEEELSKERSLHKTWERENSELSRIFGRDNKYKY